MIIEFINSNSPFLCKVKQLGKKYASTLGFMPDGGYESHAENEGIIIAQENDTLMGYLMFREVPSRSRLSIVHLCVEKEYRNRQLPIKLLEKLRERYDSFYVYNGISLNCRNDYLHANRVWEKFGFLPIDEKRSKSNEEHKLVLWWYSFNRPTLLTVDNENSERIKVMLDANVIINMMEDKITESDMYSSSVSPKCLMADWLQPETEYYYSDEMYNEINRDSNRERACNTRKFLNNFNHAECDHEQQMRVADLLSGILNGTCDNDISDRKQLSSCIVSGIKYFLTYDNDILRHKDEIEEEYGVNIMTPPEFTIAIDRVLHEEAYSPRIFEGSISVTATKISDELDTCLSHFCENSSGESKHGFRKKILSILNQGSYQVDVIKKDTNVVAMIAKGTVDNVVIIPLFRFLQSNESRTLVMGLMSQIIDSAINDGISQIEITESANNQLFKEVLCLWGFHVVNGFFRKFIVKDIVKKNQIADFCSKHGISPPKNIADDNNLLEFEKLLYPFKISDLRVPCYIVPIQPRWSFELFDNIQASDSLFGVDVTKLWNLENVYYRRASAIKEKSPARILWYASFDKDYRRSRGIVACSYLEEVQTGFPKDLYKMYKYLGVYKWNNLFTLCSGDCDRRVRALRFSHTEVFRQMVPYERIIKILGKKNTFQSPVEITQEAFFKLYTLNDEAN